MNWRRNIVVVLIGMLLFTAYAVLGTPYLPMGMTRLLTTVVILLVIGFMCGLMMTGRLSGKIALSTAVPLADFVYEGLDPAKPALTVVVAVVAVLCVWVGTFCGHLITRWRTSSASEVR